MCRKLFVPAYWRSGDHGARLVKPDFSCGLEWVTVNYRSVYGKITIDWKKEKDSYRVKISVPANSRARIELPGVTEEVGSGNYQYIVKEGSHQE